jgi:tRNA (guanine37-N1)-methyltransferase
MRRSFKSQLADILNAEEISKLHSSLEIVGDIALLKLPPLLVSKAEAIGEALLKINRNIKVVLRQVSPVRGEFRVRSLEWVTGEQRTDTVHKENGCTLKVDLSQVYFSTRLQYERSRIANLVNPGEIVLNMFAGVGSFSIVIAKMACPEKVYSIDINPVAIKYLEENASRNKVLAKVIAILGDARDVLKTTLKCIRVDRIIMPLPAKIYDYLPDAVSCLRVGSGWIHCYDMIHAAKGDNPLERVAARASRQLRDINVTFNIYGSRVVRSVGPHWYQVALDMEIYGS